MPAYTTCSSARTRSTCSTPAARSAPPSGPGRSARCARWPGTSAELWVRAPRGAGLPARRRRAAGRRRPLPAELPRRATAAAATLLFEIGVEELPPPRSPAAAEAVRRGADRQARRDPARPRRDHRARHPAPDRRHRRPTSRRASPTPTRPCAARACRAAFDADGNPTKAAQGFARGQGVDVADLAPDRRSTATSTSPSSAPSPAAAPPRCSAGCSAGARRPNCAPTRTCGGATRPVLHPADPLAAGAARRRRRAGRGVDAGRRPHHPGAPDRRRADGRGRLRRRLPGLPRGARHRARRRECAASRSSPAATELAAEVGGTVDFERRGGAASTRSPTWSSSRSRSWAASTEAT